jgi:hypothetical protein
MALLLAVTQRDRRTRRSAIGNRPQLPTLVLEGADMEKWPVIAIVDDDK